MYCKEYVAKVRLCDEIESSMCLCKTCRTFEVTNFFNAMRRSIVS